MQTAHLKSAGIYKLTCSTNGKIYIGKAVNLYKRLNRHKNCAKDVKATGFYKTRLRNMDGIHSMLKYWRH